MEAWSVVLYFAPLDGGHGPKVGRVRLRPRPRQHRVVLAIPTSDSRSPHMPTVMPIDLTAIVAIVMGMLTVLIPIAGLTALVESMARLFDSRTVEDTVEITERRVALLEQQVESLEGVIHRLKEERAFDRELKGKQSQRELSPGDPQG